MRGTIDLRTDDELVETAAAGTESAFEELYRRHADAAWGVAMSVTRDRNDAADAVSDAFTRMFQAVEQGRLSGIPFRPYLLTATRNAAIDILRRTSRVHASDEIDDGALDRSAAAVAGPSDVVMAGAEHALVARAFADLPERWRSVLWLTEVEGIPAREAAEILGLSANGAAQLAVRARAGLRERYLQAHVAEASSVACRFTTERLGAYVGGALSARDLAKVDQHLAACEDCRARRDEVEEVGSTLRRIAVPVPLFLGAAVLGRMKLTATSSSAGGGAAPAGGGAWNSATRALAGASAALLALGIVGLGFRAGDGEASGRPPAVSSREVGPTEVRGFTVTRAPEAVAFVTPDPLATLPAPDALDLAASATSTAPTTEAPAAAAPSIADAVTEESATGDPAGDDATAVQVSAEVGGTQGVGLAAGTECTGANVAGTGTECAAGSDEAKPVEATVELPGTDPIVIGLP